MRPEIMRKIAKPLLFLTAMIWGTSFVFMKISMDTIPTFYLLTLRFGVGTILLGLICWKKWCTITRDYLWRGGLLGALLFLAYAVQTKGLAITTASNSAFLTATYCVIVPFLYWFVTKKRPDGYNLASALLCITGVGLVSLSEVFTVGLGETFTLIGAFFFAAHMVAVSSVSPGKDIYLLTVIQFAVCALCSLTIALCTESFEPTNYTQPGVLFCLFYLCVLSTTVALLLQNIGQVWSDPVSAAVILSLESVLGVLFAVLVYGDTLTLRLFIGFVIIFVAIICSETKFSFLRKKTTV